MSKKHRSDLHFSPTKIKIGAKKENILDDFTAHTFPSSTSTSKEAQKSLLAFSPNLERLLTKDWFVSLQNFTFQWTVKTFGETQTLTLLSKIFEHATQLPNLRIFEWEMDCYYDPPENEEKEDENEEVDSLNELPISKDILSSNNLFPRVETMKLAFYSTHGPFVTIPIQFFESYLEKTRCLSELQLRYPTSMNPPGAWVQPASPFRFLPLL